MSCDPLPPDPATSEESVRVCVACSEQLKATDLEISSFARQRTPPAEGLTSHPTLRQPRTDTLRRSPSAEHSRVDTALCLSCGHNDIQHSCNSCGVDFCQNCTVEVKKSLLGATCECVCVLWATCECVCVMSYMCVCVCVCYEPHVRECVYVL